MEGDANWKSVIISYKKYIKNMNKEVLNPIEQSLEETDDSCPKCGNTLLIKSENNQVIKYCVTESFDVQTKSVTICGFSKVI